MGKKIGFIGAGSMAEGIIGGLINRGKKDPAEILIREVLSERESYMVKKYGVRAAADLSELWNESEILVLAVRPQDAETVTRELSSLTPRNKLLVSICAGIQMEKLAGWAGEDLGYARIMPNTQITTGRGYSALAFSGTVNDEDQKGAAAITDAIGKTLVIPETNFDAFTALGCAGPEWIMLFATALVDAGVESGLSREDARKIVNENLIATGLNLSTTDKHVFQITDGMNTPGGIGIAGYHSFQRAGLTGIVMDAVRAAYLRTTELGK